MLNVSATSTIAEPRAASQRETEKMRLALAGIELTKGYVPSQPLRNCF